MAAPFRTISSIYSNIILYNFQQYCHKIKVCPLVLPMIYIQCSHYAKPSDLMGLGGLKKGKSALKGGPVIEKVKLPVETDPEKLVNFLCGAKPYKENAEDIRLKDDSEYPDWLWTLRTGKAPIFQMLDPTTKYYWRKARTFRMALNNREKKARKF